jgi:DNA-nicking Smr family endonuclease
MAKRGSKKRAPTPPAPEPFNNPLKPELAKLRRAIGKAALSAAAERSAPPKRKQPEVARTVVRRDDTQEFLEAMQGSTPISKKRTRVRDVARTALVKGRAVDAPIDLTADEHFDVRFSDRYIRASAAGVSNETVTKLGRGEFAVRSHVDLHGMALDDARRVVDEFLAARHRHGERCVLVITGKGRNSRRQVGVLREKIPEWLARGPSARRVLAFVTARPCDGGEGALYVLLRKDATAKTRIDIVAGSGA